MSNSNKSSSSSSGGSSINSIGQGTHLNGTIKADGDIRIDGVLEGDLVTKGRLIIGVSGSVNGKVACKNAIIEGDFKGELKVSEVLNVRETAKIDGDISTGQLVVQSGAKFNVSCAMGGQVIAPKTNDN